jgi:hypothetical protein
MPTAWLKLGKMKESRREWRLLRLSPHPKIKLIVGMHFLDRLLRRGLILILVVKWLLDDRLGVPIKLFVCA